ncbi:MAG: ribose-phosphate diphosphokinase, partial [Lachnospiraceae bacterium]|nr:ribose-phosphate diphosphokinase [Candidatus Equihabitans merdae]
LDCAHMLQELEDMGVANVITFDTHDPRVENAIPMSSLENIPTTYQFIKNILRNVPDLKVDSDHMAVVSPDEGGMRRAVYLANVLGLEMGMFYNRRDYSIRNEKHEHPIVATEYLGPDVEGKDIIVIDDMISSGTKMLQTARRLKERKARRIYLCATFGLFTDGIEPFDKAYEEGLFDNVVTTNLVYQPEEYITRPYHIQCDLSKYIALIIDTMNHDGSMSPLRNPVERVHNLLKRYENKENL